MPAKARVRVLVAVAVNLLALIFLGFAATAFDRWLIAVFWVAVLAGSIVVVVKSIRQGQTTVSGQLAALPRSWQRWILDQRDQDDRHAP